MGAACNSTQHRTRSQPLTGALRCSMSRVFGALAICLGFVALVWASDAAAAAVPAAQPAPVAPKSVEGPTISGHAEFGEKLTATTGKWTGQPAAMKFTYHWDRCDASGSGCARIRPATAQSYEANAADVGKTLRVEVTASSAAGQATAVSEPTTKIGSDEGTPRLILILSLALFLALLWPLKGMLTGTDHRWSTSKTVSGVWTALLAGTLLSFVVSIFFNDSRAWDHLMHSGLAGQYGLLIGGPLGAAIAAKGIVGGQVSKGQLSKIPAENLNIGQLGLNDQGEPDLGDIQYLFFNFVAMVYFIGVVGKAPTTGLPTIPDVLLGLTSVAAVGYVAKKTLPPGAPSATLEPASGAKNTNTVITGMNLLIFEEPASTPLIVLFDNIPATVADRKRMGGKDRVEVTVPNTLAAGSYEVTVITPAPARASAGKFTVIA